MSDIYVPAPDGSWVQFPAGTSDDVMAQAMRSAYPPAKPEPAPAAGPMLGDDYGRSEEQIAEGAKAVPGALNAAADAATFGVGDRAFAAGRALRGGVSYTDALAEKRAQTEQFAHDNPATDAAMRLAGGAAGVAGPLKSGLTLAPYAFAKDTPLLARALLLGHEGAGYAAADALGHDKPVVPAMQGGMVLGAGLPVAASTAGGLYRLGSSMAAPAIEGFNKAATRIGGYMVGEGTPSRLFNIGREASIADAGPAARGVASAVASTPGEGANTMETFFEGRNAGAGTRIRDTMDAALGPKVSPEEFQQGLDARIGPKESNRLYAQALRNAPESVDVAPLVERIEADLPNRAGDAAAALSKSRTLLTEPAPPPPPVPEGSEALIAQAARSTPKAPPSLARFIAANGGLEPSEELTHLGLDKMMIPGIGKVVKPGGKPLDGHWREALVEANYLHGDPDGVGMQRDIRDELYALLGEEQRGNKIYPHDYEPPVRLDPREEALRATELDDHKAGVVRELMRSGMSPEEINPQAVDHAASMLASGSELHGANAYERAIMEGAGAPPVAPPGMPAPVAPGPDRIPRTNPRQLADVKNTLDRFMEHGDEHLSLAPSITQQPTFPYGGIRSELNKALEEQIPGSYRPGSPATEDGFPAIPGEFNPGYGHANAVASAAHGEAGAFAEGQKLLENEATHASDVARNFGQLPSYQQKALAQGLRSQLGEDIGNNADPLAEALRLVRAPEKRGKLDTVLGEGPVGTVANRLEAERTMRDTFQQVMRGSNTQNKAAGRQAIEDQSWGKLPANLTTTGMLGRSLDATIRKAHEVVTGMASDATHQSLAKMFTLPPAERDRVVAALLDRHVGRQLRQDAITGALSNRAAFAAALADQERRRSQLPPPR